MAVTTWASDDQTTRLPARARRSATAPTGTSAPRPEVSALANGYGAAWSSSATKYWTVVWAGTQRTLSSEPYLRIAGELGLDVERLEACRKEGRQADNVRADMALAQLSNISSTPSFVLGRIVNDEFVGETFSGAQPFESFKAKIDEALKAAEAPAK